MRRIIVIVAILILTGCGANFHSIYRNYDVDSDTHTKSVLIDAKQRAHYQHAEPG